MLELEANRSSSLGLKTSQFQSDCLIGGYFARYKINNTYLEVLHVSKYLSFFKNLS